MADGKVVDSPDEIGVNVDSVAPGLELNDVDGEKFVLSEACSANAGVLLVFVRGAW